MIQLNNSTDFFGPHFEKVRVQKNNQARLAMINPEFLGQNFGAFQLPNLASLVQTGSTQLPASISGWSFLVSHQGNEETVAPPESGRSVLLKAIKHHRYCEVLLKGAGPIKRFIDNNKLREKDYNFNGHLEISEACRDFINSEILWSLGAHVARPLGIVEHNQVRDFGSFEEWSCNYIRAFISQLRLSNLFDLPAADCKTFVDQAIQNISKSFDINYLDYSAYFNFILDRLAQTAAVYQSIGFTQDSLHPGQITLAGETVDMGIGHFRFHEAPTKSTEQVMHPWFRFERQAILFQNFLYRTHALKSEPEPVVLALHSKTREKQQSLYGIIRSFSPASARQIESMNPPMQFWTRFLKYFSEFQKTNIALRALSLKSSAYLDIDRAQISSLNSKSLLIFNKERNRILTNYESQIGTWDRPGLPTAFLTILRLQTLCRSNPNLALQLFAPEKVYKTTFNVSLDKTWLPLEYRALAMTNINANANANANNTICPVG